MDELVSKTCPRCKLTGEYKVRPAGGVMICLYCAGVMGSGEASRRVAGVNDFSFIGQRLKKILVEEGRDGVFRSTEPGLFCGTPSTSTGFNAHDRFRGQPEREF